MRLPVGSVVFVSHRRKRVVFRVCRVLGKKIPRNECRREDFFRQTGTARPCKVVKNTQLPLPIEMIKTTVPAGGLHNEEDLHLGKQGKSACFLSSFREHPMRAGKARVWQVHLAVRLCGFPTALFTKYSQPCHARLAFRGMCQWKRE